MPFTLKHFPKEIDFRSKFCFFNLLRLIPLQKKQVFCNNVVLYIKQYLVQKNFVFFEHIGKGQKQQ